LRGRSSFPDTGRLEALPAGIKVVRAPLVTRPGRSTAIRPGVR